MVKTQSILKAITKNGDYKKYMIYFKMNLVPNLFVIRRAISYSESRENLRHAKNCLEAVIVCLTFPSLLIFRGKGPVSNAHSFWFHSGRLTKTS